MAAWFAVKEPLAIKPALRDVFLSAGLSVVDKLNGKRATFFLTLGIHAFCAIPGLKTVYAVSLLDLRVSWNFVITPNSLDSTLSFILFIQSHGEHCTRIYKNELKVK